MTDLFKAATLCVAALFPLCSTAADSDDLRLILQQLAQIKAAYEGRIQALEALGALEDALQTPASSWK